MRSLHESFSSVPVSPSIVFIRGLLFHHSQAFPSSRSPFSRLEFIDFAIPSPNCCRPRCLSTACPSIASLSFLCLPPSTSPSLPSQVSSSHQMGHTTRFSDMCPSTSLFTLRIYSPSFAKAPSPVTAPASMTPDTGIRPSPLPLCSQNGKFSSHCLAHALDQHMSRYRTFTID